MIDRYDLHRFVRAQDPVYAAVIGSLRRGTMSAAHVEFIFPRLVSGSDARTGEPYGIGSLDEANAYIASPVLGGRYRECVRVLQGLFDRRASAVFGDADTPKLHASLTLFSEASADEFLLETMLDVWFDGLLDEATMVLIRAR